MIFQIHRGGTILENRSGSNIRAQRRSEGLLEKKIWDSAQPGIAYGSMEKIDKVSVNRARFSSPIM